MSDIILPSERSARFFEGPKGKKQFKEYVKKNPDFGSEWKEQTELHKDEFEEAMSGFEEAMESYEEAMWAKGEDVPLDKLPEELQQNVKDPPPGVQALKEKMQQGKAARQRTTWKAASEQEADKLEAEAEANDAQAEADREKADAARMKESAGGLYGYTKGTQRDVEASVRKAQRRAASLAKTLLKDASAADFLGVHAKRAGSKTARLLRAAMRDALPKIASTHPDALPFERAAAEAGHPFAFKEASSEKAAGGLYGFPTKTARNALAACTDLRAYIGEIAYDLHSRRAAKHERITGFLKEHSKTARCGYSRMMLSCYPDAPAAKQASTSRTAGSWWLPGKRPGTGVVVGTDDGGRNWFVQVGEAGKGEPILDPVVDENRLYPEEVYEVAEKHTNDEDALFALANIVEGDLDMLNDRSFGWTKMASAADRMLRKAFVPDSVDGWLEWEDGNRTAARKTAMDSYGSLNDAALVTGDDRYGKGGTKVWYTKPDFTRDMRMGYDWLVEQRGRDLSGWTIQIPTARSLADTHVLLGTVQERNPEAAYSMMQGANWSPQGEARDLIRSKGLGHTSMSVGDILQVGSNLFMVDRFGFEKIGSGRKLRKLATPYGKNQQAMLAEAGDSLKGMRDPAKLAQAIVKMCSFQKMVGNSVDMVKDALIALEEGNAIVRFDDDLFYEMRDEAERLMFPRRRATTRRRG